MSEGPEPLVRVAPDRESEGLDLVWFAAPGWVGLWLRPLPPDRVPPSTLVKFK